MSGFLGIGAATLFNPTLIGMGVHPLVASATGMYQGMYINGTATVFNLLAKRLNIPFAFWISFFGVVACYIGITQINKVVKKSGRGSILVLFLATQIIISSFIVPVMGALQEKQKHDDGENIWAFNSFC